MSARKRFLVLVLIMIAACGVGMAIMSVMLYRHNFEDHREQLQTAVQSQARLIEAVARYDAGMADQMGAEDPDQNGFAATLSQIIDAHERFEGFGETGEFTLARRDGNSIVFVLRHRRGAVEHPAPVAFDSELAEPMRRALKGLSGTVIGLDYRGVTVLAAHEVVAVLNLGIVAKIDVNEIRAPFIRSGLAAAAIAFLVVLAGTVLFFRIGNPIIAQLEAYSRDLEKEVEERKQTEEVLRVSEERYKSLFTNMQNGFALHEMVFDKEGRPIDYIFLDMNDAFEEQTTLKRADIIGRKVTEALPGIENDPADWIGTYGAVVLNGKSITFENYSPNLDRWYSVVAYRPREGQFAVVFTDITERKQAEAAHARLNAQLEAKNKELEQIVYVASHDLRSPLVNIDGYGRELERSIDDLRSAFHGDKAPTKALKAVAPLLAHEIPEALRFIRTSTSKMDALLAGLLKLSRSGRAALMIDSLDMNELIAKVVDSSEFQIKEAGAEIDISQLPPCKGDVMQVNQVFSNLLGNALQYLDPGRPGAIRISGRVEGERSIYCVEDNGIGIAAAHRQSIFEIFHRLDPAGNKGEGLGLTIVQQVLGRLSGAIWVESEPGEGSRFYVSLPAVQKN